MTDYNAGLDLSKTHVGKKTACGPFVSEWQEVENGFTILYKRCECGYVHSTKVPVQSDEAIQQVEETTQTKEAKVLRQVFRPKGLFA